MKNVKKLMWMLVIVLVFVVAVVAYADTRSIFTLTGIPSQYNGMYAVLWEESSSDWAPYLLGAENARVPEQWHIRATASRISNGTVNLPMWRVSGPNGPVQRYSGNDNVDIRIEILRSPIFTWENRWSRSGKDFEVDFTNGSARVSWSEGQ
jgi:hypothetical protein